MVIVNLSVPALDEHFDVRLDEVTPVHALIDELGEVICQSQKLAAEPSGQYLLCSQEQGRVLPLTKTLTQCGIQTGARLILV